MRRIITISLLLAIVLPYAGTEAWLRWQQKKVKKAVKWRMIGGLQKEELMVLKFSTEETKTKLSWKHSREFSFKGQWYDIVDTTLRGDSTEYLVWHDHEETALSKKLDFLVKSIWQNNPGRQEKQGRLMLFAKTLVLPIAPLSLDFSQHGIPALTCAPWMDLLGQNTTHPESPPPEAFA